ncbi:GNAT family N-acetyltransferase [Sphingomonas qomolangmaensis]|uniref:GNAT family N-acetyltransferase n=1 Tax=Sphingomonas qomolangmaensis TaxID=2918765 RepID=A0ABY5LBG3_9SPHN|nr:GNAT family N-acetyltransferase [Sphingomonas qomolangmaensis]UUL84339.1 GNAT family N-acetyltransferase [Sphingomonas qomolangmaensis]
MPNGAAGVVVRDLPLNFRVGARTVFAFPRRLVRIAVSLADAIEGRPPALPPLPADADGYSILSLPAGYPIVLPGMLAAERQRYPRYFADLALGWDAYHAGLSGNLRSGLKRKAKKLAAASGGAIDIRRYRTPAQLEAFQAIARPLAAETYQEKLLAMGLPGDAGFVAEMLRLAAADRVRAWLLFVGGEAAAYLYCPIDGGDVLYEYVGHAERFDALSPGSVLQAEALRDLMAEGGLARFDFTEGEGQHKRQFSTGHVDCADWLVLRATLANRVALAALRAFDAGVARLKLVVSSR